MAWIMDNIYNAATTIASRNFSIVLYPKNKKETKNVQK